MPLPKLETPTYELTLPSTEEKIKFRPFLVKEYKILLTAMESDAEEIYRIVSELIYACTFETVIADNYPSFDIEYLFLNIRAKSIGENTTAVISCNNCENKIQHTMDITKSEVVKTDGHSKRIELDNNLTLEMRYPSFKEVLAIYENAKSENVVELICSCIDIVYTKDEYFKIADYTKQEVDDFINSFSKEQFDKLEQFFITIPKLHQTISANCDKCGTLNTIDVEGLQNFFA